MRVIVEAESAEAMIGGMVLRSDLSNGLGYEVAAVLRNGVREQFAAGGIDPAWDPLSPRTVEEKRKLGYPRLNRRGQAPSLLMQKGAFGPENILIRTGRLITSWVRDDDPEHLEAVGIDSVSIGSNVPYAVKHQTGDGVPKRAVGITADTQEAVASRVSEYIAKGQQ